MKVIYRASSVLSSNPNPLGRNKDVILETCFESFLKAKTNDMEIIFTVDRLSEKHRKMFGKYGKLVDTKTGMQNNRNMAFKIAMEEPNEDKILFVEDDYLWVPKCLSKLDQVLNKCKLFSPYDHPAHYLEDRFKYQGKKMFMHENCTYRQAPSNTFTFACRASVLKQNRSLFMETWGDHETFVGLGELGYEMYVPVPSWATHLVTGLLAPNIDWPI